MAKQRLQRDQQKKHDQRIQRAEREETANAIRQSEAKRRRVTPLTFFLAIFLILLLMVFVHQLQWWHLKRKSKVRIEAMRPAMDTTMTIEHMPWKIRMWSIGQDRALPKALSELGRGLDDAWGNPLRIVQQDDPLPSYLISSGGEDGEFDTEDDIAIRYSMDHEQLERINTLGLEELELQTQQALQRSDRYPPSRLRR